ncbi:MAG: GNAT family N-acetyltransferase [Verrucomicrobiota bacterium]
MEVKSWLTGCRGVSLPFSDFSGPLWIRPEHSRSVYQALLELASGRKWKHLEIRAGGIPPLGAASFRTYQSHQLDLGRGIKAIEKGLHPSVGRAIRKAERGGIAVTVERSAEAMNSFYELHSRTRRRHGLPPQPVGFFRAISKNLIEADLGRIVLAKLGDVPIAGAVFLHSGGNAVYKYGASDTAHWPMRPNHLIMWTAIRHLVESGFKSLHFGRTAATDEGLIRFKLSWGAVSEPLPYFRYNGSGHAWLTEKPQSDESRPMPFRHLPLIINRLAGRLIYPHLD